MVKRSPVIIGVIGAAFVAYLGLLATKSAGDEPPVAVLYFSGPDAPPPRHPATGLLAWATPAAVQTEIARVRERRGGLATFALDASPDTLRAQCVDAGGAALALVELPAGEVGALAGALAGCGAALTVVATDAPVGEVLAAVDGPLAVLPGAFGPGVGGAVQLAAEGRVVAPWVDSRYRLGELQLDPSSLALEARVVTLRGEPAGPDAPVVFARGRPELDHDLISFGQFGLGSALAERARAATGADLALLNYLSVRAGLTGEVSMLELEEALPFHNQVVLLEMKGADVLEALSANAAEDTRFLIAAGVAAGEGGWTLGGAPLDPGATYRVATVDYLADGGRGRRPEFLRASGRLDTGLYTDRLALDLLAPAQ